MSSVALWRRTLSIFFVSVVALGAVLSHAAQALPLPSDQLTRLNRQLERGEITLEYDDRLGYLPSLLEHLDIKVDSQTLVFSKTSLQQAIINPRNPRALYFNDNVSVGAVPGGELYELVALEPSHGLVIGSSDIVALMTLEHQVGAANRMNATTLQYSRFTRDGMSDVESAQLDEEVDDLVRYLLFVDETRLTEPVKGVSSFTQTFAQRGPRDKRGRSLRDFDLRTRIFRYRLSYMVYSDLFDNLPAPVSERVYRQLYDVLTRRDAGGKYAALAAADRQAILEILIDTKSNLPTYWKASLAGAIAG